MYYIAQTFFLLLTLSLLSACSKEIQVDLETKRALTVDGSIEIYSESATLPRRQKLTLTWSQGYFDTSSFQGIEDAQVSAQDEARNTYTYTYTGKDGVYLSEPFVPKLGEKYTLNIRYKNETYTATDSMPGFFTPILKDSIVKREVFVTNDKDELNYKKLTALFFVFKDSLEIDNYYLVRFFINGKFISPSFAYITTPVVLVDRFRRGTVSGLPVIYTKPEIKKGDTLSMDLWSISEKNYHYERVIQQIAGPTNNGFVDPPKPPLRGNVRNVGNPNQNVLGFFRAVAIVSSKKAVVE